MIPIDPIMSPAEMAVDAGISIATWYRHYRPKLPIIKISARRVGARRSEWLRALEQGLPAPGSA
jgi:hypothetical protein